MKFPQHKKEKKREKNKEWKLRLTRLGNFNLDISSIERLSIELKSLLQTVQIAEFNISETFGALELSVLDDSNANDTASGEEVGNGIHSRIVWEVAKMSSVRGPGGELLRGTIASISCEQRKLSTTTSRRRSGKRVHFNTNLGLLDLLRSRRIHPCPYRDADARGEAMAECLFKSH